MEAVANWAQKVFAAAMRGPPKVYDPTIYSNKTWIGIFNQVWREEGFGAAYNKLRMESVFRKGTLVGTDGNGNKYYEDLRAPYGRTRWVEYPTPSGVWCIEHKFDGSMVSPEWHGWLHYTHDKPGPQLAAEFEKPFKMAHRMNQSLLRPEFDQEPAFHQPPGAIGARVERGRVGPKYESWAGSKQTNNKALRNYADNAKTLHIP